MHIVRPDLELRGVLIHYRLVFLDISIIIMHLLAVLAILYFFDVILVVVRDLPGAFPEGLVEFQAVTLVLLAEDRLLEPFIFIVEEHGEHFAGHLLDIPVYVHLAPGESLDAAGRLEVVTDR
jgi:hypothetical protein